MTPVEQYWADVRSALQNMMPVLVNAPAIEQVRATVAAIRSNFLVLNPDYVAPRNVTVMMDDNHSLNIDAEVWTRHEKFDHDRIVKENQEAYERFLVEQKEAQLQAERRFVALTRAHRKLLRKHDAKIPLATRGIWDTLDVYQQHAILKDIDYIVRHP